MKSGGATAMKGANHARPKTRWVPNIGEKGSCANKVSPGHVRRMGAEVVQGQQGIKNEVMPEAYRTATRAVSGFESYDQRTKVVQRGEDPYEPMPVVKGVRIGNGWLYRSAVAIFTDQQPADVLLDSFLSQVKGVASTRILGRKKILITFSSGLEMKAFEREVWISCYGILVHAWNVGTFMKIGQHWGEVLCVEDDTANCVRCDVGKVKIRTTCNSLLGHGREGERLDESSKGGDDDDVDAGMEAHSQCQEGDGAHR
ncbi:hypothetical protein Dimus_022419 [Dionaea muscipula]